jgi:hypothetical protein
MQGQVGLIGITIVFQRHPQDNRTNNMADIECYRLQCASASLLRLT